MKKTKVKKSKSHKYQDEISKQWEIFHKKYKGFFDFLEEYKIDDASNFFNYYEVKCFKIYLKKTDKNLLDYLKKKQNLGEFFDDEAFENYIINFRNIDLISNSIKFAPFFQGKGSKLTKQIYIFYYTVFEIYDAKLKSKKKPKWSEVIRSAVKIKDKQGKPLGGGKSIEKLLKAFYKFRRDNNLNSLKDYENYLENNNYNKDKIIK